MKKWEKIFNFRHELLTNLENIIKCSDGDIDMYKMELEYLKKILFDSQELEKLLGDKE